MGQQKVKLDFIKNDKKRKATFMVREKGLIKKVRELSILCDVHACAIIYSPYDVEPTVWPSTLGVQQVISEFNNMSKMERNNRSFDHTTFMQQRIEKVDGQVRKQQTRNRENEITQMMIDGMLIGKKMLQNLSLSDLDDLESKVEIKLAEIDKRIESSSTLHHDLVTPANFYLSITSQQDEQLLPITTLLPTQGVQIPMLKAPQQVASSPLQEPLDQVIANDDVHRNMWQEQEHNKLPQGFNYWVDQPLDDMVYDQGQKNHITKPQTSNSTMAYPNASYDPTLIYVKPNSYFF